jgi:hypothetical protein
MPLDNHGVHDPKALDVLWVEGDDEAQDGMSRAQVLRSLIAYLLLSNKLIVHPAYVWQSDTTHSIVMGDVGKLLTPNNTKVFLGTATDSVGAYMAARIESTSTLPQSAAGGISEHQEYIRHGTMILAREQAELDARFTASGAVIASTSSRDSEFRRLIREDLMDEGRMSDRLSGILLRDQGVRERETRETLVRLSDWTQDERTLVSGDSLLAQIVQSGAYSAHTLQALDKRAHVLHWACHITQSTRVPYVQRATDPDKLDPLDPEVFWAALRSMLGDELCNQWLASKEVDAVQVALELRATGTWTDFHQVYVGIVTAIDRLDLPIEERLVVRTLRNALPSRSRVILRRMVSLPLVSTIAGVLRTMFADPLGGALQTGGGLIGLTNEVLKQLAKYNAALRQDVVLYVRSALRRVYPDGSLLPVKIRAEDLIRSSN